MRQLCRALLPALLAALVPGAVLLSAVSATAQSTSSTPVLSPSQRLDALVQDFLAAHDDVARLVDLYRLQELNGWLQPQAVAAALAQMGAAANASPLLTAEIAAQTAIEDLRLGQADAASAEWRKLGAIDAWQAVGPFDNGSPAAIEKQEGPEKGVDLAARYPGKQREVGWRALPFDAPFGDLELASYFTPAQSASVYLVSWVESPTARPAALRLRDSGSTRVWVNGAVVFDEQGVHSSGGFDQHAAGIRLVAGWNEILAKVGNSESTDWRFSARVTSPNGEPLVLTASASPHPRPAPAGGAAPEVADLTALAKGAASTPAGERNYAWVLNHKHNFNLGDHDDTNAFSAALAADATQTPAQLDFIEHDYDQSRAYQNLEKILDREPGNPEAHLDRGAIELARNEYGPARDDFQQALGEPAVAPNTNPDAPPPAVAPIEAITRQPRAAVGLLQTYAALGIRPVVLAWAERLRAASQTTPAAAMPAAAALRRLGDNQASLDWLRAAHASDAGNWNINLQLSDAQRRVDDDRGALATLQAALPLNGDLPALEEVVARSLAGLERGPEALAAIERATREDPDDPDLRVAAGEMERHFAHPQAALQDWQAALALNPQDADLRDRIQLAQGSAGAAAEASFERPYTVAIADALADYKKQASPALESGPVVVLADTEVDNIFPSGNTGRYVQQIFRVNNTNGANQLAVYSVTYDPATEDVHYLTARVIHPDGSSADAPAAADQPVSESVGYETFYDVRNKYVQMPAIRPGDFVEIAYRVLPTTLESLYGDYFGNLLQFGSPAPTLFKQYVVITPANKSLYFKAIRFHGQAAQHTTGGETVYRWSDRNLAAFIGEPDAPPSIEQMPYIAVSSFQTWDQFGRWYTGLIRDTFVLDDDMVQTVAGLVKGKTTTEDKVDAIYRYVIQNTHYVALEFGIHGYRPYPVTQVFHRRFGDCKDKASLLIAMLHQAGVASQFVLVRVRELGVVDASIPSVADFDHAIVYVPALGRYLDGTAEFTGARELPSGDQRAFVLRIPVLQDLSASAPPAATPRAALAPEVTPELPAADDYFRRTMSGQLDANGNLRFHMHWDISGGHAPGYRGALEVPDRQAGVLQAMLHDQLPGISVTLASVRNDDDWDLPLSVDLEGTIPRFAAANGTTLLLPRQIFPTRWLPRLASLAERRYDVLTDPPAQIAEQMQLSLPAGFTAALPPATHLDQPFARFQADVQMKAGELDQTSALETTQSLIPPAEYGAFRQFWQTVDATLGRAIPVTATTSTGGGK